MGKVELAFIYTHSNYCGAEHISVCFLERGYKAGHVARYFASGAAVKGKEIQRIKERKNPTLSQ